MTTEIKPTTIKGIKRLAKTISRVESLSHSKALDRAASAAGFANYTHARRTLDSAAFVDVRVPKFTTYISVSGVHGDTGEAITYVLEVDLPRPIDDFLAPKDFRGGFLSGFSRPAADHIAWRPSRPRGGVEDLLCETARELQFMALTGLKPCQSWDIQGCIRSLPGQDHGTTWYDPKTKKGIFVDEPYHGDDIYRRAWAEVNGFDMAVTTTWGLYKPGWCPMYLFSRLSDGVDLAPIMAALEKAGRPVTRHNWNVSAKKGSRFASPQQLADRAAAKAGRMSRAA